MAVNNLEQTGKMAPRGIPGAVETLHQLLEGVHELVSQLDAKTAAVQVARPPEPPQPEMDNVKYPPPVDDGSATRQSVEQAHEKVRQIRARVEGILERLDL